MPAEIKEFRISCRQYIKGMSVHAELAVAVSPPLTEPYTASVAAAQIELRTLLAQTFEAQMKTREALSEGRDERNTAKHKISKKRQGARRQVRAGSKSGKNGKKQSRRSPRGRSDQAEAAK